MKSQKDGSQPQKKQELNALAQYQQLMHSAFDKMYKSLPKKYKELREEIAIALDEVKAEKGDSFPSANQYFHLFKRGLESQQTKLLESLLDIIQKLIAYEFLDGNCDDPQEPQPDKGRPKRRLIDSIVQAICNCTSERDNNVQLQIIRVLLTIVSTFNCKVHGYSLNQIFRSCYHICISSMNNINQQTARASLTQMTNIVFNRMEAYAGNFAIDLHNLQVLQQMSANPTGSESIGKEQRNLLQQLKEQQILFETGSRSDSVNQSSLFFGGSLGVGNNNTLLNVLISSSDTEKDLRRIWGPIAKHSSINMLTKKYATLPQAYVGKEPGGRVNISPLDQMLYSMCQNLVDNVCLYYGKQHKIKKLFDKSLQEAQEAEHVKESPSSPDSPEKEWKASQDDPEEEKGQDKISSSSINPEALEETRRRTLELTPLRAVPPNESAENLPSYKSSTKPDIENEKGIHAGKLGWCIMCRSTCEKYCRETRYPVCSSDCQKKWRALCRSADDFLVGREEPMVSQQESKQYFMDAVRIFRSITKLSLRDIPQGQMNSTTMRTKLLGLDLILRVVQNPVRTFLARHQFLDIVKQMLREGLMRHAVSSESAIFERSVSIFFQIFKRFRCSLKQEVGVFLEQIFIRILESGNSSFHHKQTILNNFQILVNESVYIFEIFVNYDCDVESPDIFSKIVEALSKISQGKFARHQHSALMTPQEEFMLRTLSLKILVLTVKSIYKAIKEQHNKENQVSEDLSDSSDSKRGSSRTPSHTSREAQSFGELSSVQIQSEQDHETDRRKIHRMSTGHSDTDKYEKTRQLKNDLARAVHKFNTKPKHGVQLLIDLGIVQKEPMKEKARDIANFLKTVPGISKSQIGDYFGEDQELNKEVMYTFIDMYNFKKTSFIDSLRILLAGFRLPGEGQKVDRVMEKFGEKYVTDNPGSFSSAEPAYILAYATIMLQTSLHNPQAKSNRMTIESFKNLVKQVENGKLDHNFLLGIYESVEREAITSSEDEEVRLRQESSTAMSYKRKQELYQKEGQNFAKKGTQLIKTAGASGNERAQPLYQTVRDASPAKPMFLTSWGAMLAVFSVLLQESEEPSIVARCLEGFVFSIRICGSYVLETQRDAFVSALVKFTSLHTLREIKDKNIECVKTLLQVATLDGNILKGSWLHVLECISRIDYMHVIGTGARRDHQFFYSEGHKHKRRTNETEQINCEKIVQHIGADKVDHVFQKSVHLDQDSIIDFIESLCKVSKEELSSPDYPRFFSLRKLVEVAEFNMERIRMVWQRIWRSVSDHFLVVGSHSNIEIAKLAVDSLRQLAYKFLLKQELSSYTYQKDFLKPFEIILLNNIHTRREVKDLVVACAIQMASMMAKNIRSGWSVLFNIYRLAASDTDRQNIRDTLNCLTYLNRDHFKTSIAPNFFEAVSCFTNLARNCRDFDSATKALHILGEMAKNMDVLIEVNLQHNASIFQQVLEVEKEDQKEALQESKGKSTIKEVVHKSLLHCLLSSIAIFLRDIRETFQQTAAQMVFSILEKECVGKAKEGVWREIFQKVIIPELDYIIVKIKELPPSTVFAPQGSLSTALAQQQSMLMENEKKEESEKIPFVQMFVPFSQKCFVQLFRSMTQMFEQALVIHPYLEQYLDSAVLSIFTELINSRINEISNLATIQFQNFLNIVGSRFTEDIWERVVLCISELSKSTLPVELLEGAEDSASILGGYGEGRLSEPPQGSNGEQPQFTQLIPKQVLSKVGEGTILPKINFQSEVFKMKGTAQHNMIKIINSISELYFNNIRTSDMLALLECLYRAYTFASDFNSRIIHRFLIWNSGFMQNLDLLPGLIRQERDSMTYYLNMLYHLYSVPDKTPSEVQMFTNKLFEACCMIMRECVYASKRSDASQKSLDKNSEEISEHKLKPHQKVPLASQYPMLQLQELDRKISTLNIIMMNAVLPILSKLRDQDLKDEAKPVTCLLIELTVSKEQLLREKVRDLLLRMFNLIQK